MGMNGALEWSSDAESIPSQRKVEPQAPPALTKPSPDCCLSVGQQHHLVMPPFKYKLFSWELSNLIKL